MKRIIIVDDEEDFCFFMKKNLEATKNFEVHICTDSNQAVNHIKEIRPNLILLDILMPGISGPDIAQELKEDESTQDIPVVFLTAVITEAEARENKNVIGGHYFVSKPVKVKELIEIINKIC